jgi:hypothetical protein
MSGVVATWDPMTGQMERRPKQECAQPRAGDGAFPLRLVQVGEAPAVGSAVVGSQYSNLTKRVVVLRLAFDLRWHRVVR